ncbi:MAG: hypothetical protein LBS94_03970 [Prevotellaceae bacterium]|nr:hypothetical protein [Prevotellaceae bacterium]
MSSYKPRCPIAFKMSKAQFEQRSAIARKLMQHLGFEAKQFDVFTKKQKILMLRFSLETPTVKAERERTVPRHYIRQLRELLIYHMKHRPYDNSENNLSCYDMATQGIPLCLHVEIMLRKGEFGEGLQKELAQQLLAKITEKDFTSNGYFGWICNQIHLETGTLSQPNFRFYGYYLNWAGLQGQNSAPPAAHLRLTFYITALESQSKHFEYKGRKRIAYLMQYTDDVVTVAHNAVVARRELFPNGLNGDFELNLYVQSHALHRFKERLNEIDPKQRNILLYQFLVECRQVVHNTPAGTLLACIFKGGLMGYFAFFVQGDDMVVSTFLPVASEHTVEGRKFCDCLGFTRAELGYLGMDKQTFFLQVDFDKIPVLKQAMEDSGLWAVKEQIAEFFRSVREPEKIAIDEQRTQFVANFFKKREEWKLRNLEGEELENLGVEERKNLEV